MNNALTVYRSNITETFSFLKETCTLEELYTRGIRLDKTGGMLLPVCRLHQDDAQMIALFSQWRRENDFAYPGRFQVTDAGTASWLRDKLLAVPDRILFLVQDAHGHNVGHIGFANCLNDEGLMEIDNVLRGVKEGNPGIMADALSCMVKWARTTLWPEGFYLRVLASNDHAVPFYRKLGLVETGRTPLRRIVSDAGSNLVPPAEGDTAAADDHFIRFALAGEPSPMSRDELAKHLKALNVDTRPVFPAISQYPIWPLRQPPLPVAKYVGDHAMNLPSGVCLSHEQVQYVCRCIREALSC